MSEAELLEEVKKLMERLQVTAEQREQIAKETIGQFDNVRYIEEKLYRLTASNFGEVVKKRPHTSCDALVKKFLSKSQPRTSAIEYGTKNENVAISKFQEISGKTVLPSGLFVDETKGFLGASPDGLIDNDKLIEVKCFEKIALSGMSLEEAVKKKMVSCLEIQNEQIQLKQNHNYFYQIQGQLGITRRKLCYFVVYTGDHNDLFIQEILSDIEFFENMTNILKQYYENCLGPEIILNRRGRNLKCKEPATILKAQEMHLKKKKN